MASKTAGGSSRNGRDSQAKYLGVKRIHNQVVKAGEIIIKQRGTKFMHGLNAGMGRDHTIFAKIPGKVQFHKNVISIACIENNISKQ